MRQGAEMTAGILLMIFGPIIGGPLIPGPLGFIAFGMGLALVLRNSRTARRRYILAQRRYPKAARWLDLGLRRRKRRAPQPFHGDGEQRERDETEDRQQHLRFQE
jgi:hypothetical protein